MSVVESIDSLARAMNVARAAAGVKLNYYRVNLSERGRKRLNGATVGGLDRQDDDTVHVRAYNVVFEQGGAATFWAAPVTSVDQTTKTFRVDSRLIASFATGAWETVEQIDEENGEKKEGE